MDCVCGASQFSESFFSRSACVAWLARVSMMAMAIWQRMVVQFMMNLLLKMIGKGGNIPGQQINEGSINDAMIYDRFQYLASLVYVNGHLVGIKPNGFIGFGTTRSEERRVGKECRSRWSPYH